MTFTYKIYARVGLHGSMIGFETKHAAMLGLVLKRLSLAKINIDKFNIYMTNNYVNLDRTFNDIDQFVDYLIQSTDKLNQNCKKINELKTFLEDNNIEVFDFGSQLTISLYNFNESLKYDEIAIHLDEKDHYEVRMISDDVTKETYNSFNADNKLIFNEDIIEGFSKDDILDIIKNIQQSYQKLFEIDQQSMINLFWFKILKN